MELVRLVLWLLHDLVNVTSYPLTSSLEFNTAAPYIKVCICKFIIVTKTNITRSVAYATRRGPLMKHELLGFEEDLHCPRHFAKSLDLCALRYGPLHVFLSVSMGHCIICPTLSYCFWLPFWYLKPFREHLKMLYIIFTILWEYQMWLNRIANLRTINKV